MVKHGKMVAVGHVGEFEATKRKFKVEPLPFAGDLFDVHADADAALRDDLAHGRREDA
jgi:hypothetical protein